MIPQNVFESYLELLIAYKKANLDKDVYLNINSIKEATKWYMNFMGNQ